MKPLRCAAVLVALGVLACDRTPERTSAPTVPMTATPPTSGMPSSVPVASRPGSSCNELLLRLPFGKTLRREDTYVANDGEERVDIGDAIPSLAARQLKLLTATAIELDGDASARFVFLTPEDAKEDRVDRGTFSESFYGIAKCGSAGYALVGEPTPLPPDIWPSIVSVERFQLPDGRPAISLVTEVSRAEVQQDLFVIAGGGVLVRGGVVAEGHVTPAGDFLRTIQLDCSGWYPAGESMVYVQIARASRAPERKEEARGNLRVAIGRDGAQQLYPAQPQALAWALVGTTAPPSWCDDGERAPPHVRCRTFDVRRFTITPPLKWIAGVWTDRKEALAARALLDGPTAKGARWLALNAKGATTMQAPDGTPALVTIGLLGDPSPPAPPPLRRH